MASTSIHARLIGGVFLALVALGHAGVAYDEPFNTATTDLANTYKQWSFNAGTIAVQLCHSFCTRARADMSIRVWRARYLISP
jgi:hypothetical protein